MEKNHLWIRILAVSLALATFLPLTAGAEDRPACDHHSLTNWQVTVEPTCTEEGKAVAACDICGSGFSKGVPALGHAYGPWHIWTPATETEEGLAHRRCIRCGAGQTQPVPVKNIAGDHSARARLTGDEALAYDALVPFILEIAAGQRTNTVVQIGELASADAAISFTETVSDFSLDLLMNALRCDLPAEMCWNSTYSNKYGYVKNGERLALFVFDLCVDPAFRADGEYTLDPAAVGSINEARANALTIVQRYEGMRDEEKLLGYWSEIQALTSYTEEPGDPSENIVPWKLVSVFDGDPATAATDAGYADAFRYLCDLGGLVSYRVEGKRNGKSHTWNIVNLDGYNYLVDLTGNDSALFLSGAEGTVDGGYVCADSQGSKVTYQYGEYFKQLWGTGVLTLSAWNYTDMHACSVQSNAPTCTADGLTVYTCTACDYRYDAVAAAPGHDFCRWYTVTEATAEAVGLEQRDCARCGVSESRPVPRADHIHAYIPVVTEPGCTLGGYTTYTCGVCGHDYVADETAPRGHDYSYHVEVTAPTCRDPGYTTCTCVCGDSYTADETPAAGHSLGETGYPVEPTCTEEGKASAKCTVCNATLSWGVSPLGHDFGVWHSCAPVAADGTGEEYGSCSRCGVFQTRPSPEKHFITDCSARSRLLGDDALAYDALLPLICAIAEGQRTNTVLRIGRGADMDVEVAFQQTVDEFSMNRVVDALMYDHPYETYWLNHYYTSATPTYEKVDGVGQRLIAVECRFSVGYPYQGENQFTLDPVTIGPAFEARKNAKAIAAKYEGLSDLEKLRGYWTELMAMTSYTQDMKHPRDDIRSYKLVSALDDDPETTVVCEGYAFAYQYLCQLGGVPCFVTGGKMNDGAHKWNTVPLNGSMYLVDVTNSEPGTFGADGSLFLAGGEGSVEEGFTLVNRWGSEVVYTYDQQNKNLWQAEVLGLSPYAYAETHECALRMDGSACTGGTAVYSCAQCGFSHTVQVDAQGHDWDGNTCVRCGQTDVLTGDVDNSGAVDPDDAIWLLYHTLFGDGLYPVSQDCDYDSSGTVDPDDAIYLLYYTLFGDGLYPLNP